MADFESLNDAFEVTGEIMPAEPKGNLDAKIEKHLNNVDHIKKDYDYTRGNLYSIIEKGQEAINGILELAGESEMPRAYEVAGQLIKNVSDATDKLMDLQKKVKELDDDKKVTGPTNVTNALFVGSTADLQKMLKEMDNGRKGKGNAA
jgi:uncharacterized protein YaaN involved in tellurite resistance